MALFKVKKNEPEPFPDKGAMPPANNLVDQIMVFRQQGFSDEQIVQQLQSQGLNPPEIYDAINQANMSAYGQQPGADQMQQQDMQQMPPQMDPGMQQQMPPDPNMQQMPPLPPMHQQQEISREKIEEVAEAIINEKWNDLLKDINKIVEWKERKESEIAKMQQEIIDIKASFDSLHKGMLGKITEYDQNISRVGTGIKAMEMTFQKILPTLTENVNRLSGIKTVKKK